MTSYLTFHVKDSVQPQTHHHRESAASLRPAVTQPGLQGAIWDAGPNRRLTVVGLEWMHSQPALLWPGPVGHHCLGHAQCPELVEPKLYTLKLGHLGKLISLSEPLFPHL